MMSSSKSVPYTFEDKELLVQILKNYPVVENKQADANNIKKKSEAWESVTTDYNSMCIEKRSVQQLKRCWDKIKRQRKQQITNKRREHTATEGGSSSKDMELVADVDEIASHLELQNRYDGDADLDPIDVTQTERSRSTSPINGTPQRALPRSKVDELMDIRIETARKEEIHMEEIHKIRLQTERAKLEVERLKIVKINLEIDVERKKLKKSAN